MTHELGSVDDSLVKPSIVHLNNSSSNLKGKLKDKNKKKVKVLVTETIAIKSQKSKAARHRCFIMFVFFVVVQAY